MSLLLLIVISIFVILSLLKIYIKLTTGWCRSKVCLVGKTAIVTGANTGIGYETALNFAQRGARVILACRDKQKALDAQARIIDETNNNNVITKTLDCSSLQSVREFAEDILKTEQRLDILVNNAGAGGMQAKTTTDGLELLMQVNHFSNFLLTNLLLDLLKKSTPSRIITVSSEAAKYAKLNSDNLNAYPGRYTVYANSKLCNILFTKELARRLKDTGVTAYSVHPGVVKTDIFRRFKGIEKFMFDIPKNIFFKTSEEGAQTTIYTAVAKNLEFSSGEHFVDCKAVAPYPTARDMELARKVWEKSEHLVKLSN